MSYALWIKYFFDLNLLQNRLQNIFFQFYQFTIVLLRTTPTSTLKPRYLSSLKIIFSIIWLSSICLKESWAFLKPRSSKYTLKGEERYFYVHKNPNIVDYKHEILAKYQKMFKELGAYLGKTLDVNKIKYFERFFDLELNEQNMWLSFGENKIK